jgi:hypothetical protein
MSNKRNWTTLKEYEEIKFEFLKGSPKSPSTVPGITMPLLPTPFRR